MFEQIQKHSLYLQVVSGAHNQGYSFELKESGPEHDLDALDAAGITYTFTNRKHIEVCIHPDHIHDETVYIHELLHADLFLKGYPRIYFYPHLDFGDTIKTILLEMENITQHSVIYNRMNEMGYYSKEINDFFIDNLVQHNNEKYNAQNRFMRSLRLLEGHLRNESALKSIKYELLRNQPHEYQLYSSMLKFLRNTNSPLGMRAALCKMVRFLNAYGKGTTSVDSYLNFFTRVDPIFSENELGKRADKVLNTITFQGKKDIFIYGIADKQCCLFLRGPEQSEVDQMLRSNSVQEFLKMI